MKIYLIAPKNPESFWTFDRLLSTINKKCVFPNLSLPTVAGLTPREHEVVLCDENVEPIDFEIDADIIGVTGYVVHQKRILEIIAAFKARNKFVVAGGPFASLCPEQLRGKVDVLFVDEAEATWPQFLREYASGAWSSEYRSLEPPSMHDSPLPRFDLLKADAYRSMTIQFARGCPFNCEFCDIIVMYGRRPRTKSVPQIMAEIEEVHRLGFPQIFIVDDNFIGNKKEAKSVLRAIIAWQKEHGYPLEFLTEVTLNVAQDEEILSLLHDAQVTTLFIGIESPRAASLKETKKTQNMREDILTSVHRVQRAGIEVMAGMIVGFDNDDEAIFDEQFRFIQDAHIPVSMTGLLNAVPKTPLYARLKEAGRLMAEHVGDQFVFTNIIPSGMSRLALYEGYRSLLKRLYDYASYRDRAMGLILNAGPAIETSSSLRDFSVLLRMLWSCVLGAPLRRAWLTLSMIAGTLWRRPGQIRRALSLALTHKHLYEYVQATCEELDLLISELHTTPNGGILPQRPNRARGARGLEVLP
jgi:radical SAM superfamily enzyme YgiQ (UPF0313 family)